MTSVSSSDAGTPRVSPAALLQHSRDVLVVIDVRGTIIYANPAISTFGYVPEQVVGKSVTEFIPEESADEVEARLIEVRRDGGGAMAPMVHRLQQANGTWRWVEASHADRIDDPEIRGIVVNLRDVTERIRTERALRESEARFRRLAENAPDIIFRVIPGKEGFDYLSPAVEELTGYPPEAYYENPQLAREHIFPGNVAAVDVADAPEGTSLVRVRHKSGEWRWVERNVVHARDDKGRLVAVEGISRDVTAAKQAEEALRASEDRLQRVLETMSDALLIFDADGRLEYVNPSAERLFAISATELMSRPYTDPAWDLRDPETGEVTPLEQRPVSRVLRTGEPVIGMELTSARGDGGRVHWQTSASPLHDADGAVVGVVAVLRDVSVQRAAAQKLEEALEREKAVSEELRELHDLKNTFLQAVSHELRTPLTSLIGFSALLEKREQISQERYFQIVRRLRANARRLEALLTDLLDLDRLTRGTLEPRRAPTNIRELVARTVEHLDLPVGRVKMLGEQLVAEVDAPRTERIVENLVANAHKHTPPEGEIVVSFRDEDGGLVIQVDDSGPGVPDDLKEVVFEPFRQGDTPATRVGGAGIGLALVEAFARLHGGRVWVEDRAAGGARFVVHLPADVQVLDNLQGEML